MEKQVKRIGVLTSGGDAPGMNAAVRAVVRTAICTGVECVGIRRGWNGLINSDFFPMNAGSVSHIIDKGGTILYTARSEEFREPSGRAKALDVCKLLGLDGLVAIGRLRKPAAPCRLWGFPPPLTTTSAAPTTPLDSIPPATPP